MALYVASWGTAAGKTAVCAAIGRWLQKNGKKTGYLKPVAIADGDVDRDADFLKQALGLTEPSEVISPLRLEDEAFLRQELAGAALGVKVKQWHDDIVRGKDLVIVEGFGDLTKGGHVADASYQLSEALNARVILVVAYATDLSWEAMASAAQRFGPALLGVVASRVPSNRIESVRAEADSRLAGKGVRVLGVVPDDRRLFGVSVAEIADQLGADALCCKDRLTELVENVMIGAMTPDSGEDYFKRKPRKAAVVRGDRPDLQLAALSTSTKCLVLTGGVAPIAQVLGWAEDKEAPILVTKQDTLSAVAEVEKAFVQARFRHPQKLDALEALLRGNLDFQSIGQGLGLTG
ncbi:MAG: phosphotransacetylase family protein [Chloroflexi bacterium]|nr:phosphotransacetylase family protein [Chloroflexota bacterium]